MTHIYRQGEMMARHVMVKLKDGRGWAVRTALTNAGEDPLRFWEEVITEQYDRIQELEKRPSRLALYGRLIDMALYRVAQKGFDRDYLIAKYLFTRMQREENQ